VKFRGAGQGRGALTAEVLCGELGRALGLPVPELVFVEVDPAFATAEPDFEVQDLLRASAGRNVGVDFLPGSLPWVPPVDPALAALVVWFDALVLNVDRTPRNPNLLTWHDRMWCIDHGAALFNQHAPQLGDPGRPLPGFDDHVLLPHARALDPPVDAARAAIGGAVAAVPEEWLLHPREDYAGFLRARLDAPERWWPRA
jgi:hypothetical protein